MAKLSWLIPRGPRAFLVVLLLVSLPLWYFRSILYLTWTILYLPVGWSRGSSEFLISEAADGFDVTFENYSARELSAGPAHKDLVPPVLHHIMLGSVPVGDTWQHARQSCLDFHPGWERRLWTDEDAEKLVAEKFPDFKETWDNYQLQIQRVDALRYLVLYEYGGVVLDMDLKCNRALGPLRRFGFVAPAAHPTGFSISFMMCSRHNEFLGKIVRNLKLYNRHWFLLPYPTVMFSTGGHFASILHMMDSNRADYKILAGPKDNPRMHSLNGRVSTPLFEHLGSSSWHSFDSSLIVSLGKYGKWVLPLLCVSAVCALIVFAVRRRRAALGKGDSSTSTADPDLEKRVE